MSRCAQPRVLVVAPLSGHFATLLRSLVRTMLPEHDVCITDWHNARDVSIDARPFGFDDYVEHLIRWLEELGRRTACRRRVPALRAGARRRRRDGPGRQPRAAAQHDLMAGPIDTRINPTKVNELAMSQADRVVRAEPDRRACRCATRARGAGSIRASCSSRAFMSMNIDRHRKAHLDLYENLANGETEKAQGHQGLL